MPSTIENMNRELLYYVLMGAFGVVVILTSLGNILIDGMHLSRVLAVIGGTIVVAATAAQWKNGTEIKPGWAIWFAAFGAGLFILGTLFAYL